MTELHIDTVEKFVTKDLMIRAAVAISTVTVENIRSVQNTSPIATVAVGRAVTGALLMASQLKASHRVGLHFRGDGPLGGIYAEANYEGHVRGCSNNPSCPLLEHDDLKVGPALGLGLLTVTQNQPHQREPYRGSVPLVSGEIAQDIAYYLQQSLQVRSIVSLGVYINEYGKVQASGGLIIELMPGASESLINKLEEQAQKARAISQLILSGSRHADLLQEFLGDFEIVPLDHNQKIEFTCNCSIEKVNRAIELLEVSDLEDMINKNESGEVKCEFCGKHYQIPVEQLKIILLKRQKVGMH